MSQSQAFIVHDLAGRKTYVLDGQEVSAETYKEATKSIPSTNRDPSCPIEPMPGRVIVQPEIEDSNITRYKSGLFKVDISGENRPTSAPIVAIGDDTDNDDVGFTFNLGDQVIFSRHAGVVVSFGDRGEQKFIVLKAGEILARIVETDNATDNAK